MRKDKVVEEGAMTPTKVIGLCMWARGENYSGQSHWADGCPVVLMGIDDSDLHHGLP
jgi:hypothetical protein